MAKLGHIIQVVGPVVDVAFSDDSIPGILHALEVNAGNRKVVLEVLQHIGDSRVRRVAM